MQEIFNQANITNTDVRLNIEVHDNKAPIMFGSYNTMLNKRKYVNNETQQFINIDTPIIGRAIYLDKCQLLTRWAAGDIVPSRDKSTLHRFFISLCL